MEEEGVIHDTGPLLCSQRWILAYMGFLFGVIGYLYRVNMSVAIVCMVTSSDLSNVTMETTNSNLTHGYNNTTNVTIGHEIKDTIMVTDGGCSQSFDVDSRQSGTNEGEFEWQKTTQSIVLAAFYYGYMVSAVPGGWLSRRYGGKHVITCCVAIQAVLTLITPVLTRLTFYGLVITRVIIGISSGACAPSWFDLIGVWALPTERSRFVTMFWLGKVAGTVIGYTSAGFLCAHGFDRGWGSVFYIHGIFGAVFVLLWVFLVHSSPSTHPRITKAELLLLQNKLPSVSRKQQRTEGVPWCRILTYIPVWAVFINHICDNWTNYLILTCLPLFIKEVLKFDVQSNGLLSSLPFISTAAGLTVAGFVADKISSTGCITTTAIRKIFTTVGSLGAAILVIVAGYVSCDSRELVIIIISLCTFFQSFCSAAGYTCNPVEMAPRYGSVIYGISNTLATLPGMVAPIVVAELTPNNTRSEWLVVFYTLAGFCLCGMLVYDAFSDSNVAPWAGEKGQELEIAEENQELQSKDND